MARPYVQIDTVSFAAAARRIVEELGEDIEAEMHQMGREMVDEVVAIVRSELPTTRHKLNQTHLENSFTYRVEHSGGEWTVALTIKPGVSSGKVGALNWGVSTTGSTYIIRPRNVPRALKFRDGVDPSMLKTKGAYAGWALRDHVMHPVSGPSQGAYFMERAQEEVLRRHGYTVV